MTKKLTPEELAANKARRAKTAAKFRSPEAQIRYEEQKAAKESGKGKQPGSLTKAPTTPENMVRNMAICGAARTGKSDAGEGICCMPAGWGTDHVGFGHCRHHMGTLPGHRKKAIRDEAIQKSIAYGAPVDIDPDTAVLQELCRTQGHVEWLIDQVHAIENGKVLESTPFGIKPAAILSLYKEERVHLVKVAEVAKRMGIQERQIQLVEEQGRMIAAVLKKFVEDPDLGLTPAQKILSRDLMRRHLLAIDTSAIEVVASVVEEE